MRLVRLPVDSARWLDFVSARDDALAFHHPAWATVLTECYGYPSFALALEDDSGSLVGGLPLLAVKRLLGGRRWVSLAFTDRCPPLDPPAGGRVLAGAVDDARRADRVARIEIRGLLAGALTEPGPKPFSHLLLLDRDPDVVAGRFKQSVARNIRKAERAGLELRRVATERDLTEGFYALHVGTRRRLGAPVQPRRFFRLLWRYMLEPGLGYAVTACKGDVDVAAIVLLTWNGTTIYKFGASDARFWELRPNNLLFADAIRTACIDGHHTFDFGRTDAWADGLRRFKLGWGCQERPLEYSVLGTPHRRTSGEVPGVAASLIQRSPAWMTRALGELFYKYAA